MDLVAGKVDHLETLAVEKGVASAAQPITTISSVPRAISNDKDKRDYYKMNSPGHGACKANEKTEKMQSLELAWKIKPNNNIK